MMSPWLRLKHAPTTLFVQKNGNRILKNMRWTSVERLKTPNSRAEVKLILSHCISTLCDHMQNKKQLIPHPQCTPLVTTVAVEGAAPSLVIIRIRSLGDAAFVFFHSAVCASTCKSATNHNPASVWLIFTSEEMAACFPLSLILQVIPPQ